MFFFRLLKILRIARHFRLDTLLWPTSRARFLLALLRPVLPQSPLSIPRAIRLRLALEALGPLFVKFGQILSTRRDLLPEDLATELAKLQDQVPPFPGQQAIHIIEKAQGQPIQALFSSFQIEALASASVAQVHLATLHDGRDAAVKVLRPGIGLIIRDDLAVLRVAASLLKTLWQDGKRLKPHEVVDEFARHLEEELDLTREAANASQLKRNFTDSKTLLVPEIYWEYCSEQVMVMQRMHGIPVSQIERLRAQGVNIPALARSGVEIFFPQVFRDGFFHADMHPGNILVNPQGQYIALDFGIMGTLSPNDKRYLARNFLAFFRRDYRAVAVAHIESGWAPAETRIEAFETAIRAVCEPIFDKPLKQISFGKLLLRLFQTSRRFNIQIQPQLVMLQKTLLNIEGLGRDMDPELDLWISAKPFLERWMSEQLGWRALVRNIKEEAPLWGTLLPQLPRLMVTALEQAHRSSQNEGIESLKKTQKKLQIQIRILMAVAFLGLVGLSSLIFILMYFINR